QQHGRRVYSTAAQDHLVATKLLRLPAHRGTNAGAARVLEQQFADLRLGDYRKIVALPDGGTEITDSGRDTPIVQIRHGERVIAVLEFTILIRHVPIAGKPERLSHRLGIVGPIVRKHAAHRDATVRTVQRAVKVDITLDLLEIGQHAL